MCSSYARRGLWDEESLPGFTEICLISLQQPQSNKVYVMFHGTTVQAATQIILGGFQVSKDGMLGRGVYVSRDIEKAKRYPLNAVKDKVVLKLRVNVGNVKMIDHQGHPWQKTWHDHGYDTAWVPAHSTMVESGLEEDCVWDPQRIKVVGIALAPRQYHLELEQLVKKHRK
ncbi:hypothetical protein FKM82_014023 [Ascaphus truei]